MTNENHRGLDAADVTAGIAVGVGCVRCFRACSSRVCVCPLKTNRRRFCYVSAVTRFNSKCFLQENESQWSVVALRILRIECLSGIAYMF